MDLCFLQSELSKTLQSLESWQAQSSEFLVRVFLYGESLQFPIGADREFQYPGLVLVLEIEIFEQGIDLRESTIQNDACFNHCLVDGVGKGDVLLHPLEPHGLIVEGGL